MNKVKQAKEFARKKHDGVTRKDGITPYFDHLRKVVKNLEKLEVANQDILCAGWLHDTIEDTDTDYDDISEQFGKTVADIVASVTKDTRLPRPIRERKYVEQLRHSMWQAKVVKLADILANIADLKNSGYNKEKQTKQVKDKIVYLKAIIPGITSNRKKLAGLKRIEQKLDRLLLKYDYASVNFELVSY